MLEDATHLALTDIVPRTKRSEQRRVMDLADYELGRSPHDDDGHVHRQLLLLGGLVGKEDAATHKVELDASAVARRDDRQVQVIDQALWS